MRAAIALTVVLLAGCTAGSRGAPCAEDYGPCGALAQCGGGSSCGSFEWAHGRGAICSRSCEDERDCPRSGGREGRCIDVARNGDFRCHRECVADGECPSGWVCQPIRSGGLVSGICLP